MVDTELKVQFPEVKLDALRYFTAKEGTTVEDELKDHLDKFYQKNVPAQVRDYVEHREGEMPALQTNEGSLVPGQQERQPRQNRRHQRDQSALEAPEPLQPQQEESASAEPEDQGMRLSM